MDRGVPDGIDVSYVGAQYDYDRTNPWTDDDAPGWGASYSDYETRTVMGNSFDNVYLHGKSIVRAGYSYVSSSLFAVEQNSVSLGGYELVDLILGEQKRSVFARDSSNWEYKTFSLNLQAAVRQYCQGGGKLLVTGAHVGSDLLGTMETTADKRFGAEVLHISSRTDRASRRGEVKWVYSPISREHGDYVFATEPNEKVNGVKSADGIEPVGLGAYTVMRYKENNISAAVGYRSVYNSIVLGFPFESIVDEYSRDALMRALLDFLNP